MNKLEKIYSDIKEVRIQGATNIAKAAIKAYLSEPTEANKKRLIGLRPTEPTLVNALNALNFMSEKKIIAHFENAQKKINIFVYKILNGKKNVYTHCHSTNVIKSLVYSRKKGRKFEVLNTETRPLFQGRRTAEELARSKIKVTTFIDSAMHGAIAKSDIVLLGADAILKNGVINKIGSESIAEIAFVHKKPLFIVADSWKFSPNNVKIEERDFHEVWKHVPKKIKVENPAFEKIEKKYIRGIISEYGILDFDDFVKLMEKK